MIKSKLVHVFFLVSVLFIFSLAGTSEAQVAGKVWKPLPLRTQAQVDAGIPGGEGFQQIYGITYAPSDPEVAYFVSDTSGVWRGEWSVIRQNPATGADEEGFFWTSHRGFADTADFGFNATGGVSLEVDPNNSNVVFVSGVATFDLADDVGGIYRGIYDGASDRMSWERVFSATYEFKEDGHLLAFDKSSAALGNATPVVYAATTDKWIVKSTDGGNSWSTLPMLSEPINPGWYTDNGDIKGKFRRKITLAQGASITTPLQNFPVLIKIPCNVPERYDIFRESRPDGSDFIFTDDAGNKLDHEIESYQPEKDAGCTNNSKGEAIFWVRIPALTADTDIYMYFGYVRTSEEIQQGISNENPAGVWDPASYTAVHHFEETEGEHFDSSSNGSDSIAHILLNMGGAEGAIGGADELALGNGHFIEFNNKLTEGDKNMITGSAGTIEIWYKPDGDPRTASSPQSLPNIAGNIDRGLGITRGISNGLHNNQARIWIYNDGREWVYEEPYGPWVPIGDIDVISFPYTNDEWIHIAWVHEIVTENGLPVNKLTAYKNGVSEGSVISGSSWATKFRIGILPGQGYWDALIGIVDELRLSNTGRSAEWIKVSYDNQSYDFEQQDSASFLKVQEIEELPEVSDIALAGNVIYAATNSGLFKIDESTTPATVSRLGADCDGTGPSGYLVCDIVNQTRVYSSYPRSLALVEVSGAADTLYVAAGEHKVFKSSDGGASFKNISDNPSYSLEPLPDAVDWNGNAKPYSSIEVSAKAPYQLYATAQYARSQFFISGDDGVTWSQPTDVALEHLLEFGGSGSVQGPTAVHPDDALKAMKVFGSPERISVTDDGGVTWRYSGNGYMGARRSTNKSSVYFDPADPAKQIYFLIDYGPVITNNNGASWTMPFDNGANPKSTLVGTADRSDPARPTIITAKGGWGKQYISISEDNGNNWKVYDGDVKADLSYIDYLAPMRGGAFQFIAMDPVNTDYVYAGARNCTVDPIVNCTWIGGYAFDTVTATWGWSWSMLSDKVVRAVTTVNNETVVYAVSGEASSTKLWRGIRDTQGVLNWTDVDTLTGIHVNFINDVDVDPDDPNRLYFATRSGFYVHDGSAWVSNIDHTLLDECLEGETSCEDSRNVNSVVAASDYVYIGMSTDERQRKNFIYRSADKGVNWENLGIDLLGYRILDGYSKVWSLAVDPVTNVLHMNTGHGNYLLCTDVDGDGYAVEGGGCGPIDLDDADATVNLAPYQSPDPNFFRPPVVENKSYKLGSIIPIKFKLEDVAGNEVNYAVASLTLQQYSDDIPTGDPYDATPTCGADSGNFFRYDSEGKQYMYNLSTKPVGFVEGDWMIIVNLDDGTERQIMIRLGKKH